MAVEVSFDFFCVCDFGQASRNFYSSNFFISNPSMLFYLVSNLVLGERFREDMANTRRETIVVIFGIHTRCHGHYWNLISPTPDLLRSRYAIHHRHL